MGPGGACALIAVSLQLAGISALPFAVGMYIPLDSSAPIFVGGLIRWLTERLRGKVGSEAESETSPGVLLSSGYIAGGTLCGLVVAFFNFLPDWFREGLSLSREGYLGEHWESSFEAKVLSVVAFLGLAVILGIIGSRKGSVEAGTGTETPRE